MADTQRTLTALLALFQSNTTGDIGFQDFRDIIETLRPGHGLMSISSTAATTLGDTTTWVPMAGTYALQAGTSKNWDMNTNGQLRYVGAADVLAVCFVPYSITCVANNQVTEVAIAKNASEINESIIQRKIGTGTDVGAGMMAALASMSTNDYFGGEVRNTTGANNVTIQKLTMIAISMAK